MAESEESPSQAEAATASASATVPTPAAPPPPGTQPFSFEAARALVESRYSCLVVMPHRRHVALPPRFLHRKRTGICLQLDAELRRYSESFQGVPVAYDDIKITKELGDIIDDIGAIHLDIEANFAVFQPQAGKKLVGMINKVAPSHIGCLVHGCFNASIPKPDHISVDEWKNFGFQIGNKVIFKVSHFDSDSAGVFCIRGKLCRNSTGEETRKEKRKKKHEKHLDEQNATEEMEIDLMTAELDREMQCNDTDNGMCNMADREDGQDIADSGTHASDSSGYHSDHAKSKKKKRKHYEEENGLLVFSPSKAKKRRTE